MIRRALITPLILMAVGCATTGETPPTETIPAGLMDAIAPQPEPEVIPPPPPPPVVGRYGRAQRIGASTVYPYEADQVYPVTVSPGRITVLQFATGEEIVRKPVSGDPDVERWVVDIAQGSVDSVVIRPLRTGMRTGMLIATSLGNYQIDVTSRARGGMDKVRWLHPEPPKPPAAARPRPSFETNAVSRSFDISGDAPWRPQSVIETAGKTYIAFPPKLGPIPRAPALFSVSGDDRIAVPFRIKTNFAKETFYEVDAPLTTAELHLDGAVVRLRRRG